MRLKSGDAKGALAAFDEGLVLQEEDRRRQQGQFQYQRDVMFSLNRVGEAKVALSDVPGGACRASRSGLRCRATSPSCARRTIEAQTDLVVGLYKIATVAVAERKDAVIDEGLQILARLDADGKLTDDQKGWSELFLTLRNGSQ